MHRPNSSVTTILGDFMNVSNSLIPSKSVNEYQLKGGVTILDKTDGLARVIFSEHYSSVTKKPTYQVFINDKALLYYPNFYSLENMNGLVQITEEDSTNTVRIFVDPEIGKNGMTRKVYFNSPSKTKDKIQYGIMTVGIVTIVLWYMRGLKTNRAE
jgi:hypothetical protein